MTETKLTPAYLPKKVPLYAQLGSALHELSQERAATLAQIKVLQKKAEELCVEIKETKDALAGKKSTKDTDTDCSELSCDHALLSRSSTESSKISGISSSLPLLLFFLLMLGKEEGKIVNCCCSQFVSILVPNSRR